MMEDERWKMEEVFWRFGRNFVYCGEVKVMGDLRV
jgi:hypothetical protein